MGGFRILDSNQFLARSVAALSPLVVSSSSRRLLHCANEYSSFQPTGTSSKFVTMMHDSVQSYLEKHNVSSFNIQAIALEGSGIVADRVQNLFQQLTAREDWVDALRNADHVFLATHSQGTVVSTHLLRKIIEQGYCAGLRFHLLCMCGIIQGPFAYLSESYALSPYFTYLESAAARELFDFQSPNTAVSEELLHSLRTILAHGVKITAIGSINDQVSLTFLFLNSSLTSASRTGRPTLLSPLRRNLSSSSAPSSLH